MEACLAACAALRLKDLDSCIALILIGPSSGGKGTTLDLFEGCHNVLRKDSITGPAFVGNASGQSKSQQAANDLLPELKNAILLSPELSTTFRGKHETVEAFFKVYTRVLDGKGLATHTATQGSHSVVGDIKFTHLMGSTPLPESTWEIMSVLGPRVLMGDIGRAKRSTVEDIAKRRSGLPYGKKVEICHKALVDVCQRMFIAGSATGTPTSVERSVEWGEDPEDITRVLIHLGMFMANARYRPKLGAVDDGPAEADRGITLLTTIARGRAMCQGRRVLEHSDLYLPTYIVISSVPDGRILKALAKHPNGLSPTGISRECDISVPTATQHVVRLKAATHLVKTCTPPVGGVGRPPDPETYICLSGRVVWLHGFKWL